MRVSFFLFSCFVFALLLSGSPLVDPQTGVVIPNYQLHKDGTISPLQQSGNALLTEWFGTEVRYERTQLQAIEQAKRTVLGAP